MFAKDKSRFAGSLPFGEGPMWNRALICDCHANGTVSGGNYVGNATFINAGWDLTNVWYMAGYPQLREFVESSEDEYHLWLFDSGASAGERGQADDPAGDNVPNLLKYAIGLDPLTYCTTVDLMLPELEQSESKFAITYQRSKDATGVILYPTWSALLSPSNWQREGFGLRKLSETATSELWEATLPTADKANAFIRLNAEFTE